MIREKKKSCFYKTILDKIGSLRKSPLQSANETVTLGILCDKKGSVKRGHGVREEQGRLWETGLCLECIWSPGSLSLLTGA